MVYLHDASTVYRELIPQCCGCCSHSLVLPQSQTRVWVIRPKRAKICVPEHFHMLIFPSSSLPMLTADEANLASRS